MAIMANQKMIFANSTPNRNRLARNCGQLSRKSVGKPGFQPPKNSRLIIVHMKTMLAYSPIMNSRYGVELYSTW